MARSIRPARISFTAWPVPRKGTWVIWMPAAIDEQFRRQMLLRGDPGGGVVQASGFALAAAISPARSFAGEDSGTTATSGTVAARQIAVWSRMMSKGGGCICGGTTAEALTVAHVHRMAIRLGAGAGQRGDGAAGAGPVLDRDALAEFAAATRGQAAGR